MFRAVAPASGSVVVVPPEYPDPAELLTRRRDLGRRLLALDAEASGMVGKRDSAPPPASLRWLHDDAVYFTTQRASLKARRIAKIGE